MSERLQETMVHIFLKPQELGVVSWEDSCGNGNGEGGLFDRGNYQLHASLSGKELISKVEAWARAKNYELVDRTADDKIVAAEFDILNDPVGCHKAWFGARPPSSAQPRG